MHGFITLSPLWDIYSVHRAHVFIVCVACDVWTFSCSMIHPLLQSAEILWTLAWEIFSIIILLCCDLNVSHPACLSQLVREQLRLSLQFTGRCYNHSSTQWDVGQIHCGYSLMFREEEEEEQRNTMRWRSHHFTGSLVGTIICSVVCDCVHSSHNVCVWCSFKLYVMSRVQEQRLRDNHSLLR